MALPVDSCTASVQPAPPQAVGQHFCVGVQLLSSSHRNAHRPNPPPTPPSTAGHCPGLLADL